MTALSTIRVHRQSPWLWLLCYALLQFLGAGCSSKTSEDTRVRDSNRARHVRVDSGVAPMRDVARLHALYLPHASVIDSDARVMETDTRGRAFTTAKIGAEECVDVLIDADEDTPHAVFVAVLDVSPSALDRAPEQSADQDEQVDKADKEARSIGQTLLAYDTQESSAWVLPHLCPSRATDIRIALRGAPQQAYQLQIHRTSSDTVDRALYAHAQRDLPGFRGYGPLQRDVLENNRRLSLPIAVSGDRCVAVTAYAEDGFEDVDARLLSLGGDVLALEVATDQASIVGPYCPLSDEVIRVEFRAYAGEGAFRWQRWESRADIGNQLIEARMTSKDGALPNATRQALVDAALTPLTAED